MQPAIYDCPCPSLFINHSKRFLCYKQFLHRIFNMSNLIKASVIQCSTVKYDLDATLDKMDRLVKVARERDGSQLAVFPEAL